MLAPITPENKLNMLPLTTSSPLVFSAPLLALLLTLEISLTEIYKHHVDHLESGLVNILVL
nr:hypothetical protein [Chlamydiota bacterium]